MLELTDKQTKHMVDMQKKKSELIKNFFPKPSSIIVEGFCVYNFVF